MSKITEYPEAARIKTGDIFIIDGADGTKKVSASTAAIELQGLTSAIHHRNVFRGKKLGSSVTSEQWNAISNGTFDDLYIGDYWTINYPGGSAINWTIADMDYWYETGYSGSGDKYYEDRLHKHHLVIVPSSTLLSKRMNEANDTTGGYLNSEMYTDTLETVRTNIKAVFGEDHVIPHYITLTNAVANGHASGWVWTESTVDLMNEWMVYGAPIFAPMNNGVTIPSNYTVDKTQLALFQLNPKAINIGVNYWLRDVVSVAAFAYVYGDGFAHYNLASSVRGVRPDSLNQQRRRRYPFRQDG